MSFPSDIAQSHLFNDSYTIQDELDLNQVWADELVTTGHASAIQFGFNNESNRVIDNEGREVIPIYETFEWIKPLYPFEWENRFNPLTPFSIAILYEAVPWVLSLVYVVLVFGGRHIMAKYNKFDLRT